MGLTITDVKVVGICSRCRKEGDEIPKNKDGSIFPDEDISCVNTAFGNCKMKICHVCKKEKKPYTVILDDSILSLIHHERAREDGEICERCDNFFAMTGEFKDASEEEFELAKKACEFTRNMFLWWEKDKSLTSHENFDGYFNEDPEKNKRGWEGTSNIIKWYREEFRDDFCTKDEVKG